METSESNARPFQTGCNSIRSDDTSQTGVPVSDGWRRHSSHRCSSDVWVLLTKYPDRYGNPIRATVWFKEGKFVAETARDPNGTPFDSLEIAQKITAVILKLDYE